jgi:RNA polymerase sigma factor (TIGR02999 family)
MSDVTHILSQIQQGDRLAAEQLLPLVYEQLRKLAAQKMAQENPGQTLQATALVHEAYVRLVDVDQAQEWDSRGHFYAAAAEAMRRILVENARRHRSQKAGGRRRRINLLDAEMTLDPAPDDLLVLDEALVKLAEENEIAAELVKIRLFAGRTVDEAAENLGVSRRTGFRHWTYAKAFLQAEIQGDGMRELS